MMRTSNTPPPPPDSQQGPLSVPISLATPTSVQGFGIALGGILSGAAAYFAASGHHMSLPVAITVTVGYALLGAACGWASIIDAIEHRLPNRLTYPLIPATLLVGIILAIVAGRGSRISSLLLSGLITGGLFFVAALITPNGIGMGDAKLAVTTGMMAGWWSYVTAMWAIFAGFFLASIIAIILILVRRASAKTPIAFGPFLVLGALLAILWNMSASPFTW